MEFGFPYLVLLVEVFHAFLEVSSGDVYFFEGSIQKEKNVDIAGICSEDTIVIPFIKSISA